MDTTTGQRLTLLIFLIFTVWLSFYIIQPPAPLPESADPASFSAERAFKHVQKIAQEPHPLGTAANDSVRSYILNQLKKVGLEPTVQEGIGTRRRGVAGYTKNIIAKIEGANPSNTILLMAHYDSRPTTLGAADDGSGTAAILEAVRALKSQNSPMKNNIWILLTDGEERGLLGAELFVDEFAELKQIDLVLNFEARGTSGPSMMFETSSPNSKLIPHFAKATTYPVANSLMYTVYKLLPNDTDMSVTKAAGLKGLNFAFAEDYLNYHTMQDSPENLSLASLQHHGSNLLSNALYFGNTNFDLNGDSEYVYFNNTTGGLIYYPSGWSFPLAVVAGLLFIIYLIYLFRTGRLSFWKYLGSSVLFIIIIGLGAVITYFGWQFIKLLHPQYQWLTQNEVYNHTWYFWGFTLLNLGLFCCVYGFDWIREKLSIHHVLAGSLTIWTLLSLGTGWYLPTASYLFTWPALMALIGLIALGDRIREHSWQSTGILAVSLVGVVFILPPYIYLIQIMLTTNNLAVSMVILMLCLGLAWPLFWQLIHPEKKWWNAGFVLAALFFFIIASATSGYDSEHKRQNNINYVQNLDTQEAFWVSQDHTTDKWTEQFLGNSYQQGEVSNINFFRNVNLLYAPAETIEIPEPTFKITSDSSSDSLRYISATLLAGQDGMGMRIDWSPSFKARVSLHGKEILNTLSLETHSGPGLYNYYFQDLSKPVNFDFILNKNNTDTDITFTFMKMGIPTNLISDYQERQSHMMPIPNRSSDITLWQKIVSLDTFN
jgi:hypothetical protein